MAADAENERVERLKSLLAEVDPRSVLEAKCRNLGIETRWVTTGPDSIMLELLLPNGPTKRRAWLPASLANAFMEHEFEAVKALGDFEAFYFADSEIIEAGIASPMAGRLLQRLPGAEPITEQLALEIDSPETEEVASEDEGELIFGVQRRRIAYDERWRLKIAGSDNSRLHIEIGTPSDRFAVFSGLRSVAATIRIHGVRSERHDELLVILESIANSVFFECDIKYNLTPRLARVRSRRTQVGVARKAISAFEDLRFPRYAYQPEPMSLYWYARSAERMPLLQFLAYYQALEYYFPVYSQRDAMNRIRNELRDPAFRLEEDAHIARIFALASQSGKG